MSIRYSELKKKEVFNIASGENYGKIQDLIIDGRNGEIQAIVVPGKKSGFLNCESLEIPFSDIEKIGTDAILVKFCGNKKDDDCCKKRDICDDKRNDRCDNRDDDKRDKKICCAEIVNIDYDEE